MFRQVFLRGSKFVGKGHIAFAQIYCQRQPSKSVLQNNSSTLVVKNLEKILFREVHIEIIVLSIFETNRQKIEF